MPRSSWCLPLAACLQSPAGERLAAPAGRRAAPSRLRWARWPAAASCSQACHPLQSCNQTPGRSAARVRRTLPACHGLPVGAVRARCPRSVPHTLAAHPMPLLPGCGALHWTRLRRAARSCQHGGRAAGGGEPALGACLAAQPLRRVCGGPVLWCAPGPLQSGPAHGARQPQVSGAQAAAAAEAVRLLAGSCTDFSGWQDSPGQLHFADVQAQPDSHQAAAWDGQKTLQQQQQLPAGKHDHSKPLG